MTKKSYKTAKKWAHGDNCHPPHRTVAFLHGNCPKIIEDFLHTVLPHIVSAETILF